MSKNPLHDTIRAIVRPEIEDIPRPIKARVVSYDEDRRVAAIECRDHLSYGSVLTIDEVPVQMAGVGVHTAGPFPGDDVWIEFQGRGISAPKVVGIADETFRMRTRELRWNHRRQGAYLPDIVTER